ncbi:uncharacterized protein LOC114169854 isoform X2 [Vigna unguiculata]|uniref:uncharacterized protein LOC114169854 isoform X2 n=1 Tax=Vigna unguiculata TaxID=3917 RepID=UPI001016DE9C|nr:uncharacterized protein LOC114169854 isoform X2 [Vigna unguiculata]
MDNNNWRPNQGTEANMDISDWRGGMQQESRQRIVNRIMDTLKRHLPISGQEGLHELQKIAQRFEEKIFSAATSQSDYLRKISLKMLTMETKSQGNMANAPNQGGPSNKPPNPVHWRMCKRCGNMRRLACSTCKGTKSIREGGLLAIGKCIGLAKHRDDRWELAIAPGVSPSSRYQHAANFDDVLIPEDHEMFIVGIQLFAATDLKKCLEGLASHLFGILKWPFSKGQLGVKFKPFSKVR